MRWNLRMKAAECGVWQATEMRQLLAEAGLELTAGKMTALWSATPTTIRLDELDVICAVLDCDPTDLLIREPHLVGTRRSQREQATTAGTRPKAAPPPGNLKSEPPV